MNKLTNEQKHRMEEEMDTYFAISFLQPGNPQEKVFKKVVDIYVSQEYQQTLGFDDAIKIHDTFAKFLSYRMIRTMLNGYDNEAYYRNTEPSQEAKTKIIDRSLLRFAQFANDMDPGMFRNVSEQVFREIFFNFPSWHEAYEPLNDKLTDNKLTLEEQLTQVSNSFNHKAINSPLKEEVFRDLIEQIGSGLKEEVKASHMKIMQDMFEGYYHKPFSPPPAPWGKSKVLKKMYELTGMKKDWEDHFLPKTSQNKVTK
jgi:hypothetical protein